MKVKQKTKMKGIFYLECVKCDLVIEGNSHSQVLYNMDVHIKAKHRRKYGKQRKRAVS